VGNLGGHGIVGGHIPLGAGAAFTAMYKKTGGICFTLFGDGAINQGTFNETLNLASLWNLPVIFIVENNGVAMGTQVERSSAEKDLAKRGLGYAMPTMNLDGNDIDKVIEVIGQTAERARKGEGPSYIVANTYRFRGHSMSDPLKYRSKEEAEAARQRDPITLYEKRLRDRKLIDDEWVEQTETEVRQIVDEAVKFADQSPHPETQEMYTDTLAEQYPLQK
jgi:pyruvate dehydrogenase E1 component alpha subunit